MNRYTEVILERTVTFSLTRFLWSFWRLKIQYKLFRFFINMCLCVCVYIHYRKGYNSKYKCTCMYPSNLPPHQLLFMQT